jgi:hypothetical protein
MSTKLRRLAIVAMGTSAVGLIATLVVVVLIGPHDARVATARAASHVDAKRRVDAGTPAVFDSEVKELAKQNPNLDLARSRVVLSDERSTVWLTPGVNGDVCLVERTTLSPDTSGATARFACRTEEDATRDGIIAGVPGAWYAYMPHGNATVAAEIRGKRTLLTARNNAFRIPADASSLTIGGAAPVALPHLGPGVTGP